MQKAGKNLRLVIDLREINKYLVKPKFRHEDLQSLSEGFEQRFWFFTWDLKSGYNHVDIFHPHQQFLGFAWDFEGVTKYFTFAVLSFGLSTTFVFVLFFFFLLYQAFTPFSSEMAADVPQLFCVFR